MLKVEKLKIKDCLLFKREHFEDHRGIYVETYNKKMYEDYIPNVEFVQDDFSRSKKNVLRGIHGDQKTWKLVHCPYGEIFLVIVDMRENSPTYRQWCGLYLSEKEFNQVLIPPGCGNGHYVMSEEGIFAYKQSTYYERETQFSIPFNDRDLDINWPLMADMPILSERDSKNS